MEQREFIDSQARHMEAKSEILEAVDCAYQISVVYECESSAERASTSAEREIDEELY